MVKRIMMLSIVVMLVFVPSASCMTWDFYENVKSINYVGGNELLVVDYGNIDANDIYQVYSFNPYTSSSSLRLYNCPTDIDHVTELSDGRLVMMTHTGEVWLIESVGLFDWGNRTVGEDCFQLADLPTPYSNEYENHIYVDGNDNLYLLPARDIDTLYQLSPPFYSNSVLYEDTPGSYMGSGIGSGGIFWNDRGGAYKVYLVTGPDTRTVIHDYGYSSTKPLHISEDSNGNLYELWRTENSESVAGVIKHYNTTDSTLTTLYTLTTGSTGLVLTDSGDLFASDTDGTITSYETIDGAVGFAPFEDGNGEGEEETGLDLITWDKSSYTTGDTASLQVNISNTKWDTANYTYYLNIYDHAELKDTQTLTEQESTKTYTFDPTQIASSFLAQSKRQHTNGTVETLTSALASFSQTGASYAITFDKDVYAKTDTMTMLYSDAPTNTTLYLQGWDADIEQNVYENTWTVSGSGSESLTVPNPNAESYTVRIIKDGYILDSDYSEISAATESHLYGVVYNAATGARIESAEVSIDDTYKLTDEIGAYSWVVETGEHDLSCALDGFQTISYDDYMISGDKEVNFYLSPNAVGDSVYVMVKDYETKAPIQYAHVIISNDTWSMGDYSSNTGLVELAAPDGTYTLKVIKDGYDNIEKTIDTSASSFFDVLMASGSYNPNAPGAGGLAEDESLTDYYNARFREFAPTAWGFFLLVIVLYLLSILTSFGGSKSRR